MTSTSSKRPQASPGRSGARQVATERREAERRGQRRRAWTWRVLGALVGVIVATAIIIVVARTQRDAAAPTTITGLARVSGQGAADPPPWPVPQSVQSQVRAAGLNLGSMGTAEHYHAHLDVLVDGRVVTVPAGIGVDPTSGTMSALHTHTPDGLLHIEAATKGQPFTLGQLFTEWNVRLTPRQVGSLEVTAGEALVIYVDGKPQSGDPAMLQLKPNQEVTLVFGDPKAKVSVPRSFDFAAAG